MWQMNGRGNRELNRIVVHTFTKAVTAYWRFGVEEKGRKFQEFPSYIFNPEGEGS